FLNSVKIPQTAPTELPAKIETKLPPKCKGLSIDYTCWERGRDHEPKKESELEPYTDYNCTGQIKDNNNNTIKTTTAVHVRIDCGHPTGIVFLIIISSIITLEVVFVAVYMVYIKKCRKSRNDMTEDMMTTTASKTVGSEVFLPEGDLYHALHPAASDSTSTNNPSTQTDSQNKTTPAVTQPAITPTTTITNATTDTNTSVPSSTQDISIALNPNSSTIIIIILHMVSVVVYMIYIKKGREFRYEKTVSSPKQMQAGRAEGGQMGAVRKRGEDEETFAVVIALLLDSGRYVFDSLLIGSVNVDEYNISTYESKWNHSIQNTAVPSEQVRENYSCRYEVVLTGSNRREHNLTDWHVTKPPFLTFHVTRGDDPDECSIPFPTLREFSAREESQTAMGTGRRPKNQIFTQLDTETNHSSTSHP
ncbi:hypothetical protein INR49_012760, partial [Caranx melampygus]